MSHWLGDDVHEPEPADLTVYESPNPIVAVLYGPDGEPIRLWRERPPFGYQPKETDP